MTPARRASHKARTKVRIVNHDFHRAEVCLPDGAIVQVWFVGGEVRVVGGDPISSVEKEILSEKVRAVFSEQKQRALFG